MTDTTTTDNPIVWLRPTPAAARHNHIVTATMKLAADGTARIAVPQSRIDSLLCFGWVIDGIETDPDVCEKALRPWYRT